MLKAQPYSWVPPPIATAHVQPDNRPLLVWWARYCESRGEVQRALACYERAGDALAVVRLHCLSDNLEAAETQVTCGAMRCVLGLSHAIGFGLVQCNVGVQCFVI